MEKTGTLSISQQTSRLEGTLLARKGADDPLAAATAFLQNRGFQDGDVITVTGTEGNVGSASVIFITNAQAAVAVTALAVRAAKRSAPKKAVAVKARSDAKKAVTKKGSARRGRAKKSKN